MAFTQDNRPLRVSTGLGPDVLLLERFSGEEHISSPYRFTLEMLSENASIDPTDVLRKPITVTVVIPGRVSVQAAIAANGTIAARREMPVGVAGEGGQVVRVLVEPGQWVGAGQTLAVIDRAVQSQQAASLAASIKVAQADADLAQAELERAQALVGRGFISKADMDRKRATRDAANARVRVSQAQYQEAFGHRFE